MSTSQEQDYILGLSAPCSGAVSDEKLEHNFEGTELRLGLPGSESPERKTGNGFFSLFGKELRDEKRSDGGKMGLTDDMNASIKWGLFADLDTPEEAGFGRNGKGTFLPSLGCNSSSNLGSETAADTSPAPSRGQVVGWPPIRSFRKPTNLHNKSKSSGAAICASLGNYIKVSMDGAPYLRKIDLKTFSSYKELSASLGRMFSCFTLGQIDRFDRDSSSSEEYVLTYEDKDGDWMLVGDVPFEMFMNSCSRLRIVKGSEAIGFVKIQMAASTNS